MHSHIAVGYKDNVLYPSIDKMLMSNIDYMKFPFGCESLTEGNDIYTLIKDTFCLLGLDKEHFGTEEWNPLQDELIKPGDTVLIKPNMVLDENKSGGGTECLYTNPSLVAVVILYVWKALESRGKIIIADAPVQGCDFGKLVEQSGYKQLVEHYQKQGMNIELKDLRGLVSHYENGVLISDIVASNGVVVDIKDESEHARLGSHNLSKMRITNYDPDELLKHHNEYKHEYFVSKDALEADVIINIPKPKSHRKAGVTIGLKNFIGVNTRKEYLPHHRMGDIKHGGDEYSKKSVLLDISSRLIDFGNRELRKKHYKRSKVLKKIAKLCSGLDKRCFSKEVIREGSWYGNDTIWRTIIDINRIVLYADKKGVMNKVPQRKIFTIGDMIVLGEKEGPLLPSPKYGGIVAASKDMACFDEAIATLLGFDINKLPLYVHLRDERKYPLVEKNKKAFIVSNCEKWNGKTIDMFEKSICVNIEPSAGWKGYVELE